MTHCHHCGADTTNGLALCELCQRKATTCLEFLPVYFRNLARQRRPGRPNGSLGMDGSWLIRRGEQEGSQVDAALAKAMTDLVAIAVMLHDDRGVEIPEERETEAETCAVLCDLFERHLTSIATLEWAGEFVRDIDRHEKALNALTEAVVPGWYAGKCQHITGRTMEGDVNTCTNPIYVVPGLTWVTCRDYVCPTHQVRPPKDGEVGRCSNCSPGCGATSHASEHIDLVLEEAREWIAPPMRIAETVVALVDTEQSVPRLYDRIKKWGTRTKIAEHRRLDGDGDPVGPKRYRLGDVLDVMFSEGPTRLNDYTMRSSA